MSGNFWAGKRALITGANGFLGSWLAIELLKRGAVVTGIIRDEIPDSNLIFSGAVDGIKMVRGSVTDFEVVLRSLRENRVEYLFHVAAQAIVGSANEDPLPTFEANIRGTWTVLEAARRTPSMKGVVVASSDKAYGTQAVPYREEAPLLGENPYDVSKVAADHLARSYARSLGLAVAVTRCSNLFGGGDLNFSRVIPGTVRSLLSDSRPIVRSDGSPVRDYLYILDAVEAYLTLAERLEDPTIRGEAFNFGLEQPLSVLDVVRSLIEISGKRHLEPVILGKGKMPGEIDQQYLEIEKAKKWLGWCPAFQMGEGLRETYKWYQQFFDSRRHLIVEAPGPSPAKESLTEKEKKLLEERLQSLGYL